MNETWEQQKARLERIESEERASFLPSRKLVAKAIRAALARLESHAELVDALTAENRVLKERALRFRDMAEMVQRAFVRDDHGAMALFGNNVVAHIAREALLAHAAPQEPTELPLGHAYVWHLPGHPCYRCGQPEVAHAAPSVGDVK